jgi:hypothetical protein
MKVVGVFVRFRAPLQHRFDSPFTEASVLLGLTVSWMRYWESVLTSGLEENFDDHLAARQSVHAMDAADRERRHCGFSPSFGTCYR